MADEATVITPDNIIHPEDPSSESSSKSLIIAKDIPPEKLMLFPLHDRPDVSKNDGTGNC